MTSRHPLRVTHLTRPACVAMLCAAVGSAWAQAPAPATPPPAASAPATACATVEVHNVRPQQGFLLVAAFADAESFGKKSLVSRRVPAGDATTRFELCGLSGSTVALTMYQDLDSDNKMGKNLLGMPTEPWGSSGKPGSFGPSWETGKVALDGSAIVVRLSQ